MAGANRRVALTDVLDRVLDKGIVIDAGIRVSVMGIELLGVEAKITVASIQTYLQLAENPVARDLGLVGALPPHATLEALERLTDRAAEAGSESAPAALENAPAGGAPPPAAEPGPPLAAYQDEELSTQPPDQEADLENGV